MNWKFWKKQSKIVWPEPRQIVVDERKEELMSYTIDIILKNDVVYTLYFEDIVQPITKKLYLDNKSFYENITDCWEYLNSKQQDFYNSKYIKEVIDDYFISQLRIAQYHLEFDNIKCYKFKLKDKEISVNGSLIKEIKLTPKKIKNVYLKTSRVV